MSYRNGFLLDFFVVSLIVTAIFVVIIGVPIGVVVGICFDKSSTLIFEIFDIIRCNRNGIIWNIALISIFATMMVFTILGLIVVVALHIAHVV